VGIIDFHVHAFPDALAARAVSRIEEMSGAKAALDGTVSGVLASMDAAGVEKSVVLSIATRPEQFESILRWSRGIASERLVPFLSVHPADPAAAEKIRIAREEGFRGMKFQPYYQDSLLDAEEMFPIYEAMQRHGLICVVHAGFDLAYPTTRRAEPARIVNVLRRFPALTFVATHLGSWKDWESVRLLLPSQPMYVETSYSLEFLPPQEARDLILSFPPDRVLFGSDSPWAHPARTRELLSRLALPPALEEAILWKNASRLLAR
jgi:predicted TIM-barrel fold metal-dependent hydrolase